MTTNIGNKVEEIKTWGATVHSDDGSIGERDVAYYVRRRWPDLLPELQAAIARAGWLALIRNSEPF